MSGAPAKATKVTLDATGADLDDPASVAGQIPAPDALPEGTTVVVEPTAVVKRGGLRRWLGDRRVPVPLSARCTALLACGYVDIRADGDVARGVVATR
jgi:hypothetical protein